MQEGFRNYWIYKLDYHINIIYSCDPKGMALEPPNSRSKEAKRPVVSSSRLLL